MAVLAVQQIRRMRGGAQGQLMLGADGHVYVVKFQTIRNTCGCWPTSFLASKLAAAAGLTTPEVELVEVSQWLVEHTQELGHRLGGRGCAARRGCSSDRGLWAGLMPGQVMDYLPEEQMAEVRNLGEFAGILALDKWTENANGRQAVFARTHGERR